MSKCLLPNFCPPFVVINTNKKFLFLLGVYYQTTNWIFHPTARENTYAEKWMDFRHSIILLSQQADELYSQFLVQSFTTPQRLLNGRTHMWEWGSSLPHIYSFTIHPVRGADKVRAHHEHPRVRILFLMLQYASSAKRMLPAFCGILNTVAKPQIFGLEQQAFKLAQTR